MRFPSLESAARGAAQTLVRFPLAILSGLIAGAALILIIDGHSGDVTPRLLAAAALGLPLATGLVTAAERSAWPAGRLWLANLVLAAGLAALFATSLGWTDQLAPLRYAQLFVAAHLLVALSPYFGAGGLNGFWQYNRFLLLRYLTASFFAVALWAGLAVALAALKQLFSLHLPDAWFGYLFAILAMVFHPWFFLAGVPDDFAALEAREDYPTGLKVFSQFVLIPLVTVYLMILTAYLGKVLITRTWPSGWIGYLVSGVSLAGVLALLLVHPIRRRSDSRWVNAYGRWWFVVLLPALVMLFLAVFKRMDQYGVTEPRYFLLVLNIWMLGVALYFAITGSANIKIIPESLLIVAVASAFGPWGAYQVARRSQTARMARVLAANGMGAPGRIRPPAGPVSRADRATVGAVIHYLYESRGPGAVAGMVGVPEDSVKAWAGSPASNDPVAYHAVLHMGLSYAERAEGSAPSGPFWAKVSRRRAMDVSRFDVARSVDFPALGWIGTDADSLELIRSGESGVVVRHGVDTLFTLDLAAAVRGAIPADSLEAKRNLLMPLAIEVTDSARGYRVRLMLDSVTGQVGESGIKLTYASGFVAAAGFRRREP